MLELQKEQMEETARLVLEEEFLQAVVEAVDLLVKMDLLVVPEAAVL
jgi:hypothetical protein